MTFMQLVLWIHVAAGFAALALGIVAMRARKQRGTHTWVGETYHWLVLIVCGLAVVVVLDDWDRFWWFLPIAIGSYAFALLGYVAAKMRWKGWLEWHVTGQGGSYIAMVTAFIVNNWHIVKAIGIPLSAGWAWALPSLIGTPIIWWVNLRIQKRSAGP